MDGIVAVSLNGKSDAIKARNIISEVYPKRGRRRSILVLTDLFGGSPSKPGIFFLDQAKIEQA